MKALSRSVLSCICLLAVLFSPLSLANSRGEQKQVFGDYEVHYIGLTSSFLTPEVASAYGIDRSRSLGFLSISVLQNQAGQDLAVPVRATITGTIRNLIGQTRTLEFREIKETNAVYYISTFRFDDEDMYTIQLKATPEGQTRTFDVKFSQRFYQQ